MSLLRQQDYPPQLPRPEAAMAFQAKAWELSEGVDGLDVAWGDDIYQRIALFPAEDPDGRVFAFIHGGRWTSGYKETMAFMAPAFNEAGITFASLGHRMPPSLYADGFSDICNGVACLVESVCAHGGDVQRIFLG